MSLTKLWTTFWRKCVCKPCKLINILHIERNINMFVTECILNPSSFRMSFLIMTYSYRVQFGHSLSRWCVSCRFNRKRNSLMGKGGNSPWHVKLSARRTNVLRAIIFRPSRSPGAAPSSQKAVLQSSCVVLFHYKLLLMCQRSDETLYFTYWKDAVALP